MRISAGVLKLCVVAVGLCCLVAVPTGQQPARGAVAPVPIYQVDPFWPKCAAAQELDHGSGAGDGD